MDKELEILIRQFREIFKRIESADEPNEDDVYKYNETFTQIEERILNMDFND